MHQFGWSITFTCNLQSMMTSPKTMTYGYKAIMSILDDTLKCCIHFLLPQDLKFRPILCIYVICEVWTASFQHMKSLKNQLVKV